MEIKLYKSPWRAIRLVLLCSIFVVGGISVLGKDDFPQWVAWMSILFFGLGYPVGIFHLLDRRPQIVINETGIFDRMAHREFINWDVIQDAYIREVHGQLFICLIIPPELEPSKSKGSIAQSLAQTSKALGFQELNISLGQIKIDVNRFGEFILAMSSANRHDRAGLLGEFSAK